MERVRKEKDLKPEEGLDDVKKQALTNAKKNLEKAWANAADRAGAQAGEND
jgi:hypothetical protein